MLEKFGEVFWRDVEDWFSRGPREEKLVGLERIRQVETVLDATSIGDPFPLFPPDCLLSAKASRKSLASK